MCIVNKHKMFYGQTATSNIHIRLGGVAISVLAIGHEVRGLKLGRGDGFLRAIKYCSTPSIGWEKSRRPHVVRFCGMLKIT
jgi:hypothetical protein